MSNFIQDPWARTTTRNGLAGDEVISALQKSIRRSKTEDACFFAYEMYTTSEQMEEKLWRRLLAISVEDVGLGNPQAAGQIKTLSDMRKEFPYSDGDRPIFFIHAIRILCESLKDRSSDLLKNIVIKSYAMGFVPEIPDIALDKHTKRGTAMGRDSFHFLNIASQVEPQMEVENNYKARYAEILETYDKNDTVESTFQYRPYQL
ncbi:hypothetical protein AwErysi_02110 [Erysipelotrichaceae bacterium]|nr:hypothetical protein AwErysi_02110 [Erysipelotrichaceae bacterium]